MTVIADTGTQRREVVVIGGGQAGLAAGSFLARQNRRFTILEAAGEPARDHLVDHPDHVLVAWIAGASHHAKTPPTPRS